MLKLERERDLLYHLKSRLVNSLTYLFFMGREIPFVGFLGATPLMLLPLLLSESKSIHRETQMTNLCEWRPKY